MPECDLGCICALLFVIITLILILIFRQRDISVTQVNNCGDDNPAPPGPPQKDPWYKIFFKYFIRICLALTISLSIAIAFCSNTGASVFKYFIYDTDYQNNDFVIGSLTTRQLIGLDVVLMEEKKKCGLRLESSRVKMMVDGDHEVVQAYDRWRHCKNFKRSFHYSIYPDERDYYIKKYSLLWAKKVPVGSRDNRICEMFKIVEIKAKLQKAVKIF